MAELPLISVLIPAYNAEPFLAKCLGSVLEQTYSNLEVVAVNDGSTDGTLPLLQGYASRDARIRVIDKPNEGVMLTRKRTVSEASADWVFFLDADDYLAPDIIERLYAAITETDCDIATSTIMRVKNGRLSSLGNAECGILDGVGLIRAMLNRDTNNGLPGKLYRKSLLSGLEYYRGISMGEDMLLNIQIAMRPDFKGICFAREAVYYYVQHDASLIRSKVSFDYQELFAGVFDRLFDAHPDIASRIEQELLRERITRFHIYIKRSGNPWMGDRPMALRTYEEVRLNRRQARQAAGCSTVAMIRLYRHRWLKPAVVAIATCQRWGNSISRRMKTGKTR